MGRSGGRIRRVEPSASSAKGIWTLNEVADYISESKWPRYVSGDPLFGKVSLLLHMNGIGSTFTDSSAYDLTVTAGGGITQSASQSKFGGKSAALSPGDYLSIAASSGFVFGTGDFCVEFWLYISSAGSNQCIVDFRNSNSTTQMFLRMTSASDFDLRIDGDSIHTFSAISGQWNHIAIARSSGAIRSYVNGTRVASTANSSNLSANGPMLVNGFFNATGNGITGYLDELRVTKGSDRGYTSSTINVPTTPFPETIPGTDPLFNNVSLLLHMDGTNGSTTFTDSSTNNLTMTANGNAQISTSQNKFGGSSGSFDGSGDYLSISNSLFNIGTDDFTLECWVYPLGWSSQNCLIVGTTEANGIQFGRYGNSNNLGIAILGVTWLISDASLPTTNTWTHIALTRKNNVIKIWINGTQSGSSYSGSANFSSNILTVGGNGSSDFNGYIDELRFTKGVCRYSSSFTPPTLAFPEPEKISVEYLVIAGGAAGGGRNTGGGGGAGGYIESSASLLQGTQYTVIVGAGGAGVTGDQTRGSNGSSSAFGTITATGGGGGGNGVGGGRAQSGNSGGSGGGGGGDDCCGPFAGGAGVLGQGYAGGAGSSPGANAGGGGGAGGVGGDSVVQVRGGGGGTGASSSITGSAVTRAGGGGGGGNYTAGAGGAGGGGAGGAGTNTGANGGSAASVNTGSGGGGTGGFETGLVSGAGGSGVVIIRSPVAETSTAGSPTVTTVGSDTVYVFTSTGSITF